MSIAPAHAATTPFPQPGKDFPVVRPSQTRAATADPAPTLNVSVQRDEIARAGGHGSVLIPVTRTGQGPKVRNLTVRVRTVKGTTVSSVSAKGWRCAGLTCTTRKAVLPEGRGPQPLFAVIDVAKNYRKQAAKVTATATWKGGQIHRSQSSTSLEVYPRMTLGLTSPSGRTITLTTNAQARSREIHLAAHLRHLAGGQADARWTQISGPKTTFVQPARSRNVRERFGQVAQLSNTIKGTHTFRFALRVDANGQVVRKTVAVKVRAQRAVGKVNGNDKALTTLAAQSRKRDKMRSHTTKVSNGVRLQAKPRFTVRPGSTTTVRVVTQRKVKAITWSAGGKQIGTGRRVQVRAPVTPHSSTVVRAHITLRNGTGLLESALVRSGSNDSSFSGPSTDADNKAFCAVADTANKALLDKAIPVSLGDLYTLTLQSKSVKEDGVRTGKGACTGKGTLTFEKATLKRGSATLLTDVGGTITVDDGVGMSKASWQIPDTLKPASAKNAVVASLQQQDKPVTAPLAKGKWGLPDGTFAVAPIKIATENVYGLSFVPLPGDWKFDPAKTLVSFLNASEEDPELQDGTVRFSQEATGPQDATAAFTVDSTTAAWQTAKIEVANLTLGQTAAGDTISAAGSGTLALNKDANNAAEITVQCLRDGQASTTCELFKGFVVKDFTLKWGRAGLGLVGQAGVQYGTPSNTYEFGLRGLYTTTRNWSLDAVSPAAWDLGTNGLQLTGLAGNVGMKPLDTDKTKSQFVAQFTGTVTGINVGSDIQLKGVTGAITNLCPQDVKDCKTGEIRVAMTADLAARLPGKPNPVALRTGAALNLSDMTFEFDFDVEDVQIGPPQLNVSKAQFILTNANTGSCVPKGMSAPAAAPNTFILQLRAQAQVLGGNIVLGGSVTGSGYCLWGKPGTIDAGASGETVTQVFGFTTYPNDAELRLPSGEQEILTQNKMSIAGKYRLPQSVKKTFNIDGDIDYVAEYTLSPQGLSFTLDYTPTAPPSLYNSGTSNLTLRELVFSMSGSPTMQKYTLSLAARGALFMKGSNGVPDSTTPLYVQAALDLDRSVSVTFQAGVDNNGNPVDNAFGQAGLTITNLNVAFTLTMPAAAAEVSLNAVVSLPQTWVGAIGVKPGTREALSFSLGGPHWCLDIEIGEESTANTKVAVDLANKGFLTASYFKLLIAPTGCEVPIGLNQTKRIEPGYGFAFIGTIVSAPVIASINASFTEGLVIKGTMNIPELNVGPVRLGGTAPGTPAKVDMDINSKAGKYDVSLDVGLAIGAPDRGIGAYVAIKGYLNTSNADFVDFELTGKGNIALGPIGMSIDPLNVKAHIAKGTRGAENTIAANAALTVKMVGVALRAQAGLRYEHQQLIELRIRAGASLDFVVGAVSGNLEFNYCLGTLSDLRDDGTGSNCKPYSKYNGAAPAYRVGFFGSYRIAWWTKGYSWTAYDQKGTEGTDPPPSPDNNPKLVDGTLPPQPSGLQDVLQWKAPQVQQNAEIKWPAKGTYIKAGAGYQVNGDNTPACKTARLGGQWNASTANPASTSVNPDPGNGSCMLVAYVTTNNSRDYTYAKCSATSCVATRGPYANQVLAADGPNGTQRQQGRDALIAGLRSPLGVLPTGARLVMDNDHAQLVAPTEAVALWVESEGLYLKSPTNTLWHPDVAGRKVVGAMELMKNGMFKVYDAQGNDWYTVGTAATGLDLDKFPPYLIVNSDGMFVEQRGTDGKENIVWGIAGGKCTPKLSSCDVKMS